MDTITQWASTHIATLIVIYGVFSNIVAALPTPNMSDPNKSPTWYILTWKACQFLALNIPRVFPSLRVAGKDKP